MTQESTLTRIPENTSFLQTTKYTFVIPELPFARYFCQTVTLPGVSTSPVEQPNLYAAIYRHGDTLRYEEFSLICLIDEDLQIWEETYNWLVSLTSPQRFTQYGKRKGRPFEKYYDGVLTINTNANIPNMRIKFTNVHPIALGGITFNTADSAENTPTCDIAFRYDWLEIERL